MQTLKNFFSELLDDESAAVDQWVSVLLLTLVGIMAFVILRPWISQLLTDQTQAITKQSGEAFTGGLPALGGAG